MSAFRRLTRVWLVSALWAGCGEVDSGARLGDGGAAHDVIVEVRADSASSVAKETGADVAADGASRGNPCGALGDACCVGAVCGDGLACASGVCGCVAASSCPMGGECRSDGRCLDTLATDQFTPDSLIVIGGSVYWANRGRGAFGSVATVSSLGGTVTTIASGREGPDFLSSDDVALYWVENSTSILRLPRTGGTLATLYTGDTSSITGFAVGSTNLYWAASLAVMTMPTAGGGAVTFTSGNGAARDLVAGGGNLFWDSSFGEILEAPMEGGATMTLAATLVSSDRLALTDADVFWVGSNGQAVESAKVNGGGATILTSGAITSDLAGIAADESNVYWTYSNPTAATGQLLKVPVIGGAPTTLATVQAQIVAVAVDATSVYWATATTVMKLTPK